MLIQNESAYSLTRCKKNIHVLKKAGMITRQNAWFANQEPISVVHDGNGDLNTHLQSEKHRKVVKGAVASTKMPNYFVTAGNKYGDETTAPEGILAFHTVKHHHCNIGQYCILVSDP